MEKFNLFFLIIIEMQFNGRCAGMQLQVKWVVDFN